MTDSHQAKTCQLQFGRRTIPYLLTVAVRKRLRIVVKPDLSVSVFAPLGFSDQEIEAAVQSKAAWIFRQQEQLKEFHPLPRPRQAVSGETVFYLGRQYRLKISKNELPSAKLKGKYLWIETPSPFDRSSIIQQIDGWYRQRAEIVFERSFTKLEPIAQRHGAADTVLSIRKMKSRWGSCSPSGRITLNLHLIQAPSHCVDYVIMHELCHAKEHNHSKKFYRLLSLCMPDWEKRKQTLRGYTVPIS